MRPSTCFFFFLYHNSLFFTTTRGLWTMKRAYQEDGHVFDRLAVGVVAVEQLPDLQELGIISAPQPLRTLLENPQLDDYILAFEEAGKDISRTEDRKEENKSSEMM